MNIAPVGCLKPASALVSSPEPRRVAGSFEPGKRPAHDPRIQVLGFRREALAAQASARISRRRGALGLHTLQRSRRPSPRRRPCRQSPPLRPVRARIARPIARWRTRTSVQIEAASRRAPRPSPGARRPARTRQKPEPTQAPAKPRTSRARPVLGLCLRLAFAENRFSRFPHAVGQPRQPAFSSAGGAAAGVRAAHWMFRYDHFTSASLRPHWVFSPRSRPCREMATPLVGSGAGLASLTS